MLEYSRDRACHELLLRMSGLIPDDTLVRCRAWLARGQFDELTRALTHPFWLPACR